MFKKMAADALGLSDIGVVVPREDFDKTDSDDFIFNEKSEKIYFLIKTKADEYCFTNLGLIHVDGANAMSKKGCYAGMIMSIVSFRMCCLKQQGQSI